MCWWRLTTNHQEEVNRRQHPLCMAAFAPDDTAFEATAATPGTRSATISPEPGAIHADLMHMSHDPKLVDKLMKKRAEEMHRRSKLLNTRSFRTGVPHQDLAPQVAAKLEKAAKEKAEDDYHDRYRIISDQVAQVCETIRHEATRERQKAVTAYSLENLRKEQRREYHLSDPNMLKKERPARECDNDPRLGASSIQQFEGEDFLANKKKSAIAAELSDWLAYQKAEKQAKAIMEKQEEVAYDQSTVTANELRGLCEKALIEEQLQEKRDESAENQRIAAMHAARRRARAEADAAAAQAHVVNEMNSDRLLEMHDYKLGVDGRLMKAEYRRCTVEEEQAVHDTNARLVLEQKARKRIDKNEDTWDAQTFQAADAVLHTLEDIKAKDQRQRRMEVDKFNEALKKEQTAQRRREKQAYMSKDHLEVFTSTANLC